MQQVELDMETEAFEDFLDGVRVTQVAWARLGVSRRLAVIRRLRKTVAGQAKELAEAVPTSLPGALHRNVADTLISEVLPLIEACRFLEREAEAILKARVLGSEGLPFWLGKVESRVERTPWGVVLILGAANYPLFLAGVQALQALVAGNAVLWKPAPGTQAVAIRLRAMLVESGLDAELLTVLDTGVESATRAIRAGVDHVVLTGSAETGKAVLRQLAETLTPATMELSGCDAVFVLPGADLQRLREALGFGLRFNGSFTCMAPRRVFLVGLGERTADAFEAELKRELADLGAVWVSARGRELVGESIEDALGQGSEILLDGLSQTSSQVGVTLIGRATPGLRSMQTDVFAPVLSVMRVKDVDEALAANSACPYALTASIFGDDREAQALASRLRVGNVLINDVIVSTADPRVPFGGRGRSGFGVTRGAEGLLGMTTPRTIQSRRGGKKDRAYLVTSSEHVEFFAGVAQMMHGGGLRVRLAGLRRTIGAARKMK